MPSHSAIVTVPITYEDQFYRCHVDLNTSAIEIEVVKYDQHNPVLPENDSRYDFLCTLAFDTLEDYVVPRIDRIMNER